MIPERMAAHIAAATRARHWLGDRGVKVVKECFFMNRPLLEITCPPAELVMMASRISEHSNGGSRSVWVATLDDCRVIWR
ncbi:TPA: hypothetical protein ACNV1G_004562 [Citrobacter amalonaticus]